MNHVVRICPVTAGRPTRTVSRHAVVATRVGAEGIGRAHGDYRRLIAGRMNLPVYFPAVCVLAVVAGSGNHDYARVNQRARGATDWIILVSTDSRSAESYVDNATVAVIYTQPLRRVPRFGRSGRPNHPVE